MVIHCTKRFLWSTKTWGTSLTVSAIPNMQLFKRERVGMNEAGPITDLASCEEAIQTAVQKQSFSQRIQKFVDFHLAGGDRRTTGLVTEALFHATLE